MIDDATLSTRARALAANLEPCVGQVYFSPESHAEYVALGFTESRGEVGGVAMPDPVAYFTSRGSLMGQVAPQVVAAAFAVFNPDIVGPCVEMGWGLTDAPTIFAARRRGAVGQLTRVLGARPEGVERAVAIMERAVAPLNVCGRPLFAGLRSQWDDPTDPLTRFFHLGDELREYRGDAYTAAWTSAGLDAVEIGLLTELFLGLPLRSYIRSRAWSDEQMDAAFERLVQRGWVDGDAFTPAGHDAREAVERDTDRQLRPAIEAIGDDFDELITIIGPWGEAVRNAGGYLRTPAAACAPRMSGDTLPATMPAAVYTGSGVMEVQEIAVPDLHDEGALVEVSHCGICGTDLHFVLEGMGRPGAVFGHEWAGTLVALGSAASDAIPLGTPVVAADRAGCGRCRSCRAGRPAVCVERAGPNFFGGTGAFTRYKHVDASSLLPLPPGLALRDAALTEPVAIAMHARTLSGVEPGDRVLVTGAGPVGMLMLAVLKAAGIDDITVSEPAPARRERAAALGAAVATPDSFPTPPMGRPVAEPFTVAFECSGRAAATTTALDQLDRAGRFVFLGTGAESPTINHNRVIIMEQTLIGSYNYDPDGFRAALDLLASGRLPLDLLIEPDDVPLDEVGPTMRRLGAGELPGKALVVPRVGP